MGDVEVGEGDEDGGGLHVHPSALSLFLQVDDGLQRLADGLGEVDRTDARGVVADHGGDGGGFRSDVESVVARGEVERSRHGVGLNLLRVGTLGLVTVDGDVRGVAHGGGLDVRIVGGDARGPLLGSAAGDVVEVCDAGGDGLEGGVANGPGDDAGGHLPGHVDVGPGVGIEGGGLAGRRGVGGCVGVEGGGHVETVHSLRHSVLLRRGEAPGGDEVAVLNFAVLIHELEDTRGSSSSKTVHVC